MGRVNLQLISRLLIAGLFVNFVEMNEECALGRLDPLTESQCKNVTGGVGYAMRCNNTDLQTVPTRYPSRTAKLTPPLCLLDLSQNNISKVGNVSFVNKTNINASDVVWLYLHNNHLTYIEARAFEGLVNLWYLNLSHNSLEWKGGFATGVFRPLLSLKFLNLKANPFRSFYKLDEELVFLKNMTSLLINMIGQNMTFGPYFQNLTNLKNLSLSGMESGTCVLQTLGNNSFINLGQIKTLFISGCEVKTIDPIAFEPLKQLENLDLSYNEKLKFKGMNTALFGLRNSSTLKQLRVNRIHRLFELGNSLKVEHLENFRTLRSIEILHMDLNKIEVFDKDIFLQSYLPLSLRTVTFSGNRLCYGEYVQYLHMAVNLVKIDASRQYLMYDPYFHRGDSLTPPSFLSSGDDLAEHVYYSTPQLSLQNRNTDGIYQKHILPYLNSNDPNLNITNFQIKLAKLICRCNESTNKYLCLPPKLKVLIFRKSFLYLEIPKLIICGADSVIKLDMSFNLVHGWHGPVLGFPNLKMLNLSENYCNNVSSDFFYFFPELTHLNISGNNLGKSFDPNVNMKSDQMFRTLKNLKILDMSYNQIYNLPKDLFTNAIKLECLNISNNNLKVWNSELKSRNFSFLDLRSNKLHTLPVSLRNFLDNSTERNKVILYLGYNKIDCSSLPFLKWMMNTPVHIYFSPIDTCLVNEHEERMVHQEDVQNIVNILEHQVCMKPEKWLTWTVGISCSVLGGILTMIVSGVVYRNRWKIRYIYYNRKRRYIHQGFERIFSYDAYISYARGKASFIYSSLVPKLEGEHSLRVWVTDRDSAVGVGVAENIVYGISNSRKTVLLIDDEYLQDSWCDYDMNMALVDSVQTERSSIIIVLMLSYRPDKIPVHILRTLAQQQPIEYPENHSDIEGFWTNLATEIAN